MCKKAILTFIGNISSMKLLDNRRFWGVVLFLMFAIVGLAYIDAVIPPQTGWWQYYSWRMSEGDVLYKDLYLFMPPYFIFLTRFLYLFIGNRFLLYTLLVGFPVKAGCVWIMYRILCRMTRPFYACFSTFLGFCLSISYFQDMWYDFNPIIMLPCLCVGLLTIKYYEQIKRGIVSYRIAFLIGWFLSIICCLKQTVGFAYSVTAIIIAILLYMREYEGTKQRFINGIWWALGGVLVGVLPLICYLSIYDCWQDFFNGILSIGQAKGGSFYDIFFRWFHAFSDHKIWIYLLLIVVIWRTLRLSSREVTKSFSIEYRSAWWGIVSVVVIIGVLAVYPQLPLDFHETFSGNHFLLKWRSRIYCMLIYSAFLMWLIHIGRYFIRKKTVPSLLIFTSFAIAHFFVGIMSSDNLEEIFFLMYVPWMLAYAFNAVCPSKGYKDLFILTIIAVFSLQSFSLKISVPYSWQGWATSTIKGKHVRSTIRGLEGFRLPPYIDYSYKQMIEIIETYTTKDDRVFQFANMPLFNVLTERVIPGFAPITWFDVCPDGVARKVAAQLYAAPPKMIIWHNMNDDNWTIAEEYFRGGAISGQRKIQEFYDDYVQTRYQRLYRVNNNRDGYIELWLRKE